MKDTAKDIIKWTAILIVSGLVVEYIWHTGLGQALIAHAEGIPLGSNIGPKIIGNNTPPSQAQILIV